jgi:hypothetical protein
MTDISKISGWQRERALLLQQICEGVEARISAGMTGKAAIADACREFSGALLEGGKALKLSPKTLFNLLADWRKAGRVAGAFVLEYRPGKKQVPQELVREFQRLASLAGMRNHSPAINELKRQWYQGKPVAGLGTWQEWWVMNQPGSPLPPQAPEFPWAERTLYRHKIPVAKQLLGSQGVAAFKRANVHVLMTTKQLRPVELFVLDDKRPDIYVIDDESGEITDVTVYLCQNAASHRIVGFSARPAVAMNSSDVDALVARVLESEGYGRDYTTHFLFERGTVAMSEPAQLMLEQVTGGHIKIHRTSMDGGKKAPGFEADKGIGHPEGKAILENFNRKFDLLTMMLPGQRGNKHDVQPANLAFSQRKRVVKQDTGDVTERVTTGGEAGTASLIAQVEIACGRKLGLQTGLLWMTEFNMILRELIKDHNAARGQEYEGHGYITEREIAPNVWSN